jgi:hypothetical protein
VAALLAGQRILRGPESLSAVKIPNVESRIATLINVTNCRFDRKRSTADLKRGDAIHPGESLHLLEGVAEVTLSMPGGGPSSMQLEGPLAIMLTSEGMPNLLYGRMTGLFTCGRERFVLDTPLGRVLITGNASIGLVAAANDLELHVFSGEAIFEPWTMDFTGSSDQLRAASGASIRAQVDTDGSVSVVRGRARESRFVTTATIAASRLNISDKYVAAIRDAEPIGYWRFENDVNGVIRNEMGDYLHCRMVGDAVRLRRTNTSRTAEFGFTTGPGYLLTDDAAVNVAESYSAELWAKPTYVHHGELFSLLQWDSSESPMGTQCFQIELCGPVSGYKTEMRPVEFNPGRVRLIHCTAECFSTPAYSVRRWQHIVATKDATTMRLYLDGVLVATQLDERRLSPNLRVMMGQLFPQSNHLRDEVTSRLFVGEIDEVALYDRQLSEAEVVSHYRLLRPDIEPGAQF